MKFALQILHNGESRMVDASGNPLGKRDVNRPILHIIPKLLVPAEMLGPLSYPYDGLVPEEVTLKVTSSLPIDISPEGGIEVRQPYPNRRYFVGGSNLIRNGWIVPLPSGVTEFDIEFHWYIDSASVWRIVPKDDWQIRHLHHIKLHPGNGVTYSMDASCWTKRKDSVMRVSPVTVLGFENEDQIDRDRRQIIKDSDLVYTDGENKGELAGYFIEEQIDITGVPLEQVWSIDAFHDEQLHEVKQTAIFAQENEAHRANSPIEMPAELFVEAVKLARDISFGKESDFAVSVAGVPGGFEQHPAMKLLCNWWDSVRPKDEPFKPGSAMPLVRVRDDGEYWWGHHEIPNSQIDGFNPSGRNAARVGDQILVMFQATQDNAIFDKDGITVFLPSGEPYNTIGINKKDYLSGEWDEAWFCLKALSSFPSRFHAVWQFLNKLGSEYRMTERAKRCKSVVLPEGFRPCSYCGKLPEVTEDQAGKPNIRFLLRCGDHASIAGDSLEEIIEDWEREIEDIE